VLNKRVEREKMKYNRSEDIQRNDNENIWIKGGEQKGWG
jgi:hypothetical protein